MDDQIDFGPHAVGFRTYDGADVVLQVMASVPTPPSDEAWKADPYRDLQERLEAYKALHQGIKIRIDFKDNL